MNITQVINKKALTQTLLRLGALHQIELLDNSADTVYSLQGAINDLQAIANCPNNTLEIKEHALFLLQVYKHSQQQILQSIKNKL